MYRKGPRPHRRSQPPTYGHYGPARTRPQNGLRSAYRTSSASSRTSHSNKTLHHGSNTSGMKSTSIQPQKGISTTQGPWGASAWNADGSKANNNASGLKWGTSQAPWGASAWNADGSKSNNTSSGSTDSVIKSVELEPTAPLRVDILDQMKKRMKKPPVRKEPQLFEDPKPKYDPSKIIALINRPMPHQFEYSFVSLKEELELDQYAFNYSVTDVEAAKLSELDELKNKITHRFYELQGSLLAFGKSNDNNRYKWILDSELDSDEKNKVQDLSSKLKRQAEFILDQACTAMVQCNMKIKERKDMQE